MKDILIVVDMQNDFIDGSLGTKEAVAIVPAAVDYVKNFDGEIIFTRDTHYANYLETQEGKNLPVEHCIKGSAGWQVCDALKPFMTEETVVFNKPTFGSTALADYLKSKTDVSSITLLGLCTDICVISNALLAKAALPEVPVKVVEAACAGVTPESHTNALAAMKMCQIEVI